MNAPADNNSANTNNPAATTSKLQAQLSAEQYEQLEAAGLLFGDDRCEEARALVEPIIAQTSNIAEVHELYGLILYRQQEWAAAIAELETFSELAQTVEQYPVLMDCYRAQHDWIKVESLWEAMQASEPSQQALSEGVMVVAGGLADRDQFADAIHALETQLQEFQASWDSHGSKGRKKPRKVKEPELRILYLLADLHCSACDIPQAVALFKKITKLRPDFLDASVRLAELGGE